MLINERPPIFDEFTFEQLLEGVVDPRTLRFIKVQRRYFNSTMARCLAVMRRHTTPKSEPYFISRERFIACPDEFGEQNRKGNPNAHTWQSGSYKIIGPWKLIEFLGKPGHGRITEEGMAFVDGQISIPAAGYFENYRSRFHGWDDNAGLYTFQQAWRHSYKDDEANNHSRRLPSEAGLDLGFEW